MTTLAPQSEKETLSPRYSLRAAATWLIVLACAVAGMAALPVIYSAYKTWTTDPLRSVGIFFFLFAVVLMVRGFRRFSGPAQPTMWGLLPAAAAVGLIVFGRNHELLLAWAGHLELDLLPASVAIALFAASILLLTGGSALLWQMLFPVVLLAITNPVPHFLSVNMDLPLQRVSAETARRFAMLIGQHPTGEQLQLMFTPDFGMFIAPGCNGIRGAVTLGYLALFGAVWRGLRPKFCAAFLVAGVLLGYLFNFLRLFTLVLYYRLGEVFPSIQPYGTQVDYAIGGVLFLVASYGLGRLVFQTRTQSVVPKSRGWSTQSAPAFAAGMLAFTAICAVLAALNLKQLIQDAHATQRRTTFVNWLPATVGGFHLVKTWDDFSEERIRLYSWGLYSDGSSRDDVAMGLWMPPNEHDVRYSHAARGEQLAQQAPIVLQRTRTDQVGYATYLLAKDDSEELVASLVCHPCGDIVPGHDKRHGVLVIRYVEPVKYFARPQPHNIVLTHDAPAMTVTADELRRPIEQFLGALNENSLLISER